MTAFRWGILGAARISRSLIPAIRAAGGEVAALGVSEPDSERARAFSREWDVPLVGDYAAVMASDVDAVYNPLPNDLHHPWTLAALRAGKHALTEKPFVMNAAEAEDLALAAEQHGRVLMEAFAPRFHPYMRRVLEIAHGGELGELRAVRTAFGFGLSNPQDFRWELARGGGALYDVGTYCVNAARLLLGEPTSVSAAARWTPAGVDMGLSGVLDYGSALVSLDCAFDWPASAPQRLTVVGTRGTLDAGRVSGGSTTEPIALYIKVGDDERAEAFEAHNAYASMVAHFQQAARGEEALSYPPADAVAQARVLDALYSSARTGQRVEIGS